MPAAAESDDELEMVEEDDGEKSKPKTVQVGGFTKVLDDNGAGEDWGPRMNRGCTDILWLVLFIAFVVGLVGLGYQAYKYGDPDRLRWGTDMLGNRVRSRRRIRPFLALFLLTRVLFSSAASTTPTASTSRTPTSWIIPTSPSCTGRTPSTATSRFASRSVPRRISTR
jgi:hypothetical protein